MDFWNVPPVSLFQTSTRSVKQNVDIKPIVFLEQITFRTLLHFVLFIFPTLFCDHLDNSKCNSKCFPMFYLSCKMTVDQWRVVYSRLSCSYYGHHLNQLKLIHCSPSSITVIFKSAVSQNIFSFGCILKQGSQSFLWSTSLAHGWCCVP